MSWNNMDFAISTISWNFMNRAELYSVVMVFVDFPFSILLSMSLN